MFVNGRKISSIIITNVVGALIKLKGMNNHPKRTCLLEGHFPYIGFLNWDLVVG